jgi:hypothetical protein
MGGPGSAYGSAMMGGSRRMPGMVGGGPGGPGGIAGMPGMAGGNRPSGAGLPALTPENPDGSSGSTDPNVKGKKVYLTRTEFIILFLWKEPTPSDSLLSPQEMPAGGGYGAYGGGASSPMPMSSGGGGAALTAKRFPWQLWTFRG